MTGTNTTPGQEPWLYPELLGTAARGWEEPKSTPYTMNGQVQQWCWASFISDVNTKAGFIEKQGFDCLDLGRDNLGPIFHHLSSVQKIFFDVFSRFCSC